MKRHFRYRLFVDPQVQGMLMLRCLAYWVAMLMTVTVLLIVFRTISGEPKNFSQHLEEMWAQYKMPFLATVFLLPLLMYDLSKLSNRFVGPIVRLRRSLRDLANGDPIRMLHFRAGDFWSDVADEFNAAAARMQVLEKKIARLEAALLEHAPETAPVPEQESAPSSEVPGLETPGDLVLCYSLDRI